MFWTVPGFTITEAHLCSNSLQLSQSSRSLDRKNLQRYWLFETTRERFELNIDNANEHWQNKIGIQEHKHTIKEHLNRIFHRMKRLVECFLEHFSAYEFSSKKDEKEISKSTNTGPLILLFKQIY